MPRGRFIVATWRSRIVRRSTFLDWHHSVNLHRHQKMALVIVHRLPVEFNRCPSQNLTDLPLGLFLVGQQGRPRKEMQTAKQRAQNTSWMRQVTIKGTQRIRVVLWGGRR